MFDVEAVKVVPGDRGVLSPESRGATGEPSPYTIDRGGASSSSDELAEFEMTCDGSLLEEVGVGLSS